MRAKQQRIRRRIREALAGLTPTEAWSILRAMAEEYLQEARKQSEREAASRERGY